MTGPNKEECNASQTVVCVTPPVNSNSLENDSSIRKKYLPDDVTFGPQEHETSCPGFHQNNPSKTINDLPLELITWILHAVIDDMTNIPHFEGGYYLGTLKDLASVCRTWKSIIQSTPSFWTVIESTSTTEEIEYMLHKSRNCALTFRCVKEPIFNHGIFPTDDVSGDKFLALASLNMCRCSSLSVRLADYRAIRLLESPAPILREATIVAVGSSYSSGLRVVLFDGQAGMLEDLFLSHIPIRWDAGLPPKLRRMKISYKSPYITLPPYPFQVVSALSSCTEIEIVDISGPNLSHGLLAWADLEVPGPIVELPVLKELKIEGMLIVGSSYIVGHLWAPTLQNLQIKEKSSGYPVTSLLQTPNPLLLESIRRVLSRSKIFHFTTGPEHIFIEISGAEGRVDIELCCTGPDELGRWLVEEFVSELSSVPEFKLEVTSARPGSELNSLRKLLGALNNVVALDCACANAAAGILAEHLASPYETSDGWRWNWPYLRHLKLGDTYQWHELALNMFRERYGSFQEEVEEPQASVGTQRWHPCPLDTLSLPGLNSSHPTTFHDIAGIFGEGALEKDDL